MIFSNLNDSMIPSMLMVPVMGKVMPAGGMWRWELEGETSWDNKNRKRSGATVLRVIISSFGSDLPIFKDFCHVKRDRRWFIFGFFHLSWNVQLDMERKARQEREIFYPHFCGVQHPPEVLPGDCGSKEEEKAQTGKRRITEWIILQWDLLGLHRVI